MSTKLKALKLDIETNKQRLNFAVSTRNDELTNRTLRLLSILKGQFVDEASKSLELKQDVRFYLVFSEENMDGQRMSATEYRAFSKRLSRLNRADFETHIAVEIEVGMEQATDQAILVGPKVGSKKTA